jgi:hypothetical protein
LKVLRVNSDGDQAWRKKNSNGSGSTPGWRYAGKHGIQLIIVDPVYGKTGSGVSTS